MTNKIALVTGSTSGIGHGIATALAKSGFNIMLHGSRPPEKAEDLRAELETTHGIKAAYCSADLTKDDAVAHLMQELQDKLGPADILVNNAGIQHVAPIDECPDDIWNDILAVNLTAAFQAIKLALPHMKARKWGRIINIASAHGLVASPFKSPYVTAKHGLIGLTKGVALEVAEHGITCNAICPGYVLTPLVEKQIPDQARSRGISEDEVIRDVLLAPQATKQFVTADQLGAFAAFLATDAASQITGAALPMDGGWTAA